MNNKLIYAIVGIFLLAGISFAFYWASIRPAQARASCQKTVDDTINNKLFSQGYFKDSKGNWVHGADHYKYNGPQSKPPLLPNGLIDWSKVASEPDIACSNGNDTNDPLCVHTRTADSIDPYFFNQVKQDANDQYTPCLRRHGV